VRGPLSARAVNAKDFALGDPGILADELVGLQDKNYDLGVLPHWQDNTDLVRKYRRIMPKGTSILAIDPTENPLEVVRKIGQCRRLVTSSLHGMIVADAFGMARKVEICPLMLKDGGDFKFRDYSASIHTPFKNGVMMAAPRARVEDLKSQIYDAFKLAKGYLL
jgi:pyruvyltransferase